MRIVGYFGAFLAHSNAYVGGLKGWAIINAAAGHGNNFMLGF
jgi:hypothetical protein